jgi:hypothetical protein
MRKLAFPKREEQDMFEAVFKIVALVESNEQGQRVFKVSERGALANDEQFSSLVATVYQQDVYRTLRTGDTLTITVHLDVPPREIERTVRFREDDQFEGDGVQKPTPDLLPMISTIYEQFRQQVLPGDVFRVTFRVQRP